MTPQQKQTLKDLLGMWALAFAAIIVFRIFTSQAKTAATVAFLYLPIWWIDRNGYTLSDFGLTLAHWRDDLKALLVMIALVFPPFIGGFFAFVKILPHLPDKWVAVLTPYGGELPHLAFRLPQPPLPGSLVKLLGWLGIPAAGGFAHGLELALLIVDQFLVVGLSEEFFYRGFLQKRLREVFPGGAVIRGVQFGGAFWLTQALFAVGHLAEFHPWRLAVFFPAILFGILREKTGRLPAGIAFHALCNLAIFTLEASAFPR
ncbi:MAG: CPBP family intramembrane metalloprotease [Deltaproteobacteria bacterium]|nr:CPBP family intramembrane metalloprotease [Deltaproteobacteria bacterium]